MKASVKRPHTHQVLKPPSLLCMALEGRAVFEWSSYLAAWPLLKNAPRGDGHPVLVLPGLIAGDRSTFPIRRYLDRLGYAVYKWDQGINIGPREDVIRGLIDKIKQMQLQHDQKISIVGWSMGGAMANALALRMPERIRSVITLGSPHTGHPKGTNAWRVFELVSGFSHDDPRLMELIAGNPSVPTTSIMSKTDGIVNWRMSLASNHAMAENIEVSATHLGMGANAVVLWAMADRLAQKEGEWKPFDKNATAFHSLFFRDPHRFRLADLIAP